MASWFSSLDALAASKHTISLSIPLVNTCNQLSWLSSVTIETGSYEERKHCQRTSKPCGRSQKTNIICVLRWESSPAKVTEDDFSKWLKY
jgi:hypothetical protein